MAKKFKDPISGEETWWEKQDNGTWIPVQDPELVEEAEKRGRFTAFRTGFTESMKQLGENSVSLFNEDAEDYTPPPELLASKEAYPFSTGAGAFVSELAQIAGPSSVISKGLRAAPAVDKVFNDAPTATRTAMDALFSGTTAGLREGGSKEDRAAAVLEEGVWAGAGGLLDKMLSGIKVTDDAATILDEGGYLTPGQASQNPIWTSIEGLADMLPFLSRPFDRARVKGSNEWRDIVTNRVAAKLGFKPKGTIREQYRQIHDVMDGGYSSIFKSIDSVDASVFDQMIRDTAAVVKQTGDPRAARPLMSLMKKYRAALQKGRGVPGDLIDEFDRQLRDLAGNNNNNVVLQDMVKKMRENWYDYLPTEEAMKLRNLDTVFPDYLTLRGVLDRSGSSGNLDEFSPKDLLRAGGNVANPGQVAAGNAPLQNIAEAGQSTIGRDLGDPLFERGRNIVRGVEIPFIPEEGIDAGARFLGNVITGNTTAHKVAKSVPGIDLLSLSKLAPAAEGKFEETDPYEEYIKNLIRELAGTQ